MDIENGHSKSVLDVEPDDRHAVGGRKSNCGESSMDNDFLTEQDISDRLHISLGTLRRWRLESRGPKFRKLGTLVRYGEYDLSQWMESQPSGGTRELGRIPPSKAQSSHGGVRKTA
jgi:predicted DNA-binding transcriptional regulator AlpA